MPQQVLKGLHYRLLCLWLPGNSSESEEDPSVADTGSLGPPGTHRAPDSKFHPGHTKMDVIKRGHAKDSQRYKVDYEAQSTDTQNFSSESKRDTEYVSGTLVPLLTRWVGPAWALQGHEVPVGSGALWVSPASCERAAWSPSFHKGQ